MCVIYGCHPSDDQSSCYCSRRSVNPSQGSPTDLSSTLEDNPQAMKCIHEQFTVKSVGSEWPPGVKESVQNTVIPLTLAWYAVLANIIQVL